MRSISAGIMEKINFLIDKKKFIQYLILEFSEYTLIYTE